MGFRTGAFAKIWEVTPMSDTSTKLRMSVSRKNKQSGEYSNPVLGTVYIKHRRGCGILPNR